MKKLIVTILAAVITLSSLSAQGGLDVLRYNPDVRSAGAGDTFMGDASGMYIYSNPTSFLYNANMAYGGYSFGMFPKIGDNGRMMAHTVAAGYMFDKHAIQIGFRMLSGLEVDNIDDNLLNKGVLTPRDMTFDLGYSYKVNENIAAYITGTYIMAELDEKASTFGASLGAYYKNAFAVGSNEYNYNVGMAINNIGAPIKYSSGSYSIPANISLGGSIAIPLAENHTIKPALTAQYYFANSFGAGIGVEYEAMDMISARVGLHVGDNNTYYTIGIGAKVKMATINLSYQIADKTSPVNGLLRLGVGVNF